MLTQRLQRLVEHMAQLSEQEQDDLAARIEADLEEEQRWASTMQEVGDLVLDQLLQEARHQVAQGETRRLSHCSNPQSR